MNGTVSSKPTPKLPTNFVKLLPMTFLPVSLSLANRKVLVVGSKPGADHLLEELAAQQAQVVRVGCTSTLTQPDNVIVYDRPFQPDDLDDCWLVITACTSESENSAVKRLCDERRLFCSIATDKQNSSWLLPETSNPQLPATIALHPTYKNNPLHGNGLVSLVGAGPGDPDLLTLRALKLIKNADAIVYDRLVSQSILKLCNPDAEFIYAGKAKSDHALPQDAINGLLVQLAGKHKNVIRLKGGDPFIFGRGGEEIEELADQNIKFQVVPGITAASGCAAFSGIPLTHRDHAQSCIFVTGHLRDGEFNLNWQELMDPRQTIVVYMGLSGIDQICKSLVHHGRSADTPAALIERGTDPEQQVLSGTLQNLSQLVEDNHVAAPTLLIIGSVVTLRDKLDWFNPLDTSTQFCISTATLNDSRVRNRENHGLHARLDPANPVTSDGHVKPDIQQIHQSHHS